MQMHVKKAVLLTGEQLKTIPLQVAAAVLGGVPDRGVKQSHNSQSWIINEHKVGLTINKNVWIDNSNKEGFGWGAVKLVQYFFGCDYHTARDFLSENLSNSTTPLSYLDFDLVKVASEGTHDQSEVDYCEATWQKVRSYLTNNRNIDPVVVDNLHTINDEVGGIVGSDFRGNVVFSRQSGGAFLRGTTGDFKGTVGSSDCGCFIISPNPKPGAVIFCESGIDALSLHQLYSSLKIICIGGNSISLSRAIKNVLPTDEVYSGFDNDGQGSKFDEQLAVLRPDRIQFFSPVGKDWNDYLKSL